MAKAASQPRTWLMSGVTTSTSLSISISRSMRGGAVPAEVDCTAAGASRPREGFSRRMRKHMSRTAVAAGPLPCGKVGFSG